MRHYPGSSHDQEVRFQPNIGLDSDVRQSVVEILNITLADITLLASKTHSARWHVQGRGYLDLRNLFDQQFQEMNSITDEIAERVRILGGVAISSFQEFLQSTRLGEQPGVIPTIIRLLADHECCVRHLREDARKCTEEYEDAVTFDLFVSMLRRHEKMAWVLRSFIESDPAFITES
jgi:starvation-inducible DNA-binding protein